MVLSIFSCACQPSVCLLWWNVCLGLFPIFLIGLFVFPVLSCRSCLHILEINSLSVVSFATVSSHSEGCLFTLLVVSFAVQKLLSLIRSRLFTFVFISVTLGGGSQRILLWFMSLSVLPMLSSKSFIVSGFTFRSLIHFVYLCVWCLLESALILFFYMYILLPFIKESVFNWFL